MNSTQETSTLRRKWGSFQQNKRRSTETAWLTCQRREVGDCTLRANEGNNSFMTHMEYFQIRSRKQWTGARQRTSPRLRLVRLAPALRGEFVMNADLWEATGTCAESWYPNAVIRRGEMSHYTYIYISLNGPDAILKNVIDKRKLPVLFYLFFLWKVHFIRPLPRQRTN